MINTVLVRLIILFCTIISSIFTARLLGPEARGTYYFWTSTVAIIIQFGSLGYHSSNTYLIAKKGFNPSILLSNSVYISIIMGTCLSIFVVSYYNYIESNKVVDNTILLAITFLSISGLISFFAGNILIALNKIKEFNITELLARVTPILLIILVVIFIPKPIVLIWTLCIISIITLVLYYYTLREIVELRKLDIKIFKSGFNYGIKSYIICSLSAFIPKLNIYLIEPYFSSLDFGIWSLSSQIFDVLLIIPSSIALVLLPKMMKSKKPNIIKKDYLKKILYIMIILCGIFIFFGKYTIRILYGDEYILAYKYMILLIPGLISYSLISLISQYLATLGMPKEMIYIWIMVLIIQLSITNTTINKIGIEGSMISLSISYTLGFIMFYIFSNQYERFLKINNKNILKN